MPQSRNHAATWVIACVGGLVLVSQVGCWRPRPNGASGGGWTAPGWERGPLAGAEAQAGASFQASWDAPGAPVSIVGNSTDPDGQRGQSDLITEHTLEEVAELLVPSVNRAGDGGLFVERPGPTESAERCLRPGDGGLVEGPCEMPTDTLSGFE